ncbi:MAG TPA: LPXTG cell wall anchor domain-containing protein [Clostridia bacterium]|nr:LPXTG cell wall anchor domain-containing protein [Clostridia bacterium]
MQKGFSCGKIKPPAGRFRQPDSQIIERSFFRMKKLFALVLTLALVFAIAAPAMAATWGAGTANPGSPYVVNVTRLQKSTDNLGNTYYTAYPANLGVIANTPVYFQVDFSIPDDTELAAFYPNPTTAGKLGGSIKLTNISTPDVEAYFIDGVKQADATPTAPFVADNLTGFDATKFPANATGDAIVYSIIVSGVVTKTADASVTATLGYSASASLPITKTIGGVTYELSDPTNATTATITDKDDTTNPTVMTLTLSGSSVVTGMELSVDGVDYTVQPGPVFQYVDGTTNKITTLTDPTILAGVVAKYNALTGLLGFKAGDTGIYYTAGNILANFGYTNKATDTETYKAYNSSLTVTDGTSVPNTGDNMSVIGFVMVGLALLATAAVVVKKVRA